MDCMNILKISKGFEGGVGFISIASAIGFLLSVLYNKIYFFLLDIDTNKLPLTFSDYILSFNLWINYVLFLVIYCLIMFCFNLIYKRNMIKDTRIIIPFRLKFNLNKEIYKKQIDSFKKIIRFMIFIFVLLLFMDAIFIIQISISNKLTLSFLAITGIYLVIILFNFYRYKYYIKSSDLEKYFSPVGFFILGLTFFTWITAIFIIFSFGSITPIVETNMKYNSDELNIVRIFDKGYLVINNLENKLMFVSNDGKEIYFKTKNTIFNYNGKIVLIKGGDLEFNNIIYKIKEKISYLITFIFYF